jgi:hypothetical protein
MNREDRMPRGWTTARLDDLFASITDGDHQPPPQATNGVPFIVIGNLANLNPWLPWMCHPAW